MIDVAEHLNLVRHVIKKYNYTSPRDMDEDDLFQIGCIGLIKAVEKFDPSRGGKFSTHAAVWIRSELSRVLIGYTRQKRQAITAQIDQKVAGTDAVLAEVIPGDYSLENDAITQMRIKEAMQHEPFIVSCLLMGDDNPRVAKRMGISAQRVHQRLKAMRENLIQ